METLEAIKIPANISRLPIMEEARAYNHLGSLVRLDGLFGPIYNNSKLSLVWASVAGGAEMPVNVYDWPLSEVAKIKEECTALAIQSSEYAVDFRSRAKGDYISSIGFFTISAVFGSRAIAVEHKNVEKKHVPEMQKYDAICAGVGAALFFVVAVEKIFAGRWARKISNDEFLTAALALGNVQACNDAIQSASEAAPSMPK